MNIESKCTLDLPNSKFLKWRLGLRDLLGRGTFQARDNREQAKAAVDWIKRAQDATPDAGVSMMYCVRQGWRASYPETTGYIIPTLLAYAEVAGDGDCRQRALAMADWLIDIQMDCGGIQAGGIDAAEKVPTIFNTGQVLFGFVAAYKETGDEKYRAAARKATDWLADSQKQDGSWTKFASPYAAFRDNTYNARTAAGIYEVYEITADGRYLDAAVKNFKLALERQNPDGWFSKNCLSDRSRPLLHTIGYTFEGIVRVGTALADEQLIRAAELTGRALIRQQKKDGSLPGRFDADWRPCVKWSCLTGVAQVALSWSLLHRTLPDDGFLEAAKKANTFLKSTQDLAHSNPGIRGAIKGSHPVFGKYCEYGFPNWATKFFVDSLLLEEDVGSVLKPVQARRANATPPSRPQVEN